jgi:1,4-alpha-glucan branching enzyme
LRGKAAKAKASESSIAPGPRHVEPVALLEEHTRDGELRSVTFEYFHPGAREVFLAGAFNGWQSHATPMARQRGGRWTSTILLKPGSYEYRVIVDGQWREDPMSARFVANPFGDLNSVVEVKPMQAQVRA